MSLTLLCLAVKRTYLNCVKTIVIMKVYTKFPLHINTVIMLCIDERFTREREEFRPVDLSRNIIVIQYSFASQHTLYSSFYC